MKFLRNALLFLVIFSGILYFSPTFSKALGRVLFYPVSKIQELYFYLSDSDSLTQSTISGESFTQDVFSSKKIEKAKEIIQNNYYHFNEKSKKDIEDGVLKSIVESLGDKHSTYFNPKDAKDFAEVLRGDFEGIGAVIDEHLKGIIIRKVFDTSPAKKAGLQDGDIIIKVGNESMVGVQSEDAVKKIRGPKGSKVLVSYLRGKDEVKSVEITRDTILIPSVQSIILSGSTTGYIEVAFFGENTTDEFRSELQKLTDSGATAIILDFRDNGGGFLDTAVDILSYFFPEDTLVVRTRENDPKMTQELKTHKVEGILDTKIPVIMLINGLSASATEIVAGAFQDYGRAILVGEKSYGKGSVQEPFILDDGSILKITVGRWYTPKDQNIDKNGITPDVVVPIFEADYVEKNDRQMNAAKEIIQLMSISGATRDSVILEAKKKDFTK